MPERLPRDLGSAIKALTLDSYLTRALGKSFCDEFIKLKAGEWEAYNLQVSDWELRRYADAF